MSCPLMRSHGNTAHLLALMIRRLYRAFSMAGPCAWKDLPTVVCAPDVTSGQFRRELKTSVPRDVGALRLVLNVPSAKAVT
jgi:hypothetical protein